MVGASGGYSVLIHFVLRLLIVVLCLSQYSLLNIETSLSPIFSDDFQHIFLTYSNDLSNGHNLSFLLILHVYNEFAEKHYL